MTKVEKKMIRLQIIGLLNQCEGCKYRSKENTCIHICPSCPIGQQMQELGKKLGGQPKVAEKKPTQKQKQKKKTLVMRRWTTEEEEFILMNQHHMTKMQLAQKLGRTYYSVRQKPTKLNAERKRLAGGSETHNMVVPL
jgi:hypothetical protein